MTLSEKAIAIHHQGYNCAQSVFSVFAPAMGLDEATAKKTGASFGAGFGRTQNACGALTGALMAIGVKYHNDNDISGSKEIVYEMTREFIRQFQQKHQFTQCLDLIGVDFSQPGGLQKAKEQGLFKSRCEVLIQDAVGILEKML